MDKQITIKLETAREMYNYGIESLMLIALKIFTKEELKPSKQLK